MTRISPPPAARCVAFVDETMFIEEVNSYRVSLVFEGEDGYRPTGNWPYSGKVGEALPWFWGKTLEEARAACDDHNARMGISRLEAARIVARSMSKVGFRR